MSNPILELAESLEAANRAYRDGAAIMTDSEYDALERQLAEVAPNHALLTSLEDDSVGLDGVTEAHTIPMGSQLKALSVPELDPWVRRCSLIPSSPIFVSMKLDGASVELTYRAGKLVRALTRGNGVSGVNITKVAQLVPSIPKTLLEDVDCVVRGELMLTIPKLALVNAERVAAKEEPMANCRNGCVGIMKGAANIKYAHHLDFKAFDLMYVD